MDVVMRIPSPPLNAYINCLWCCEGPTPCPRLKVLPMPSLHLMINLSDAYHVFAANHAEPLATCSESWSVGLWNAYHIMDWPRDMRLFNVSFKPGGAYPFLQLPLAELHNHIVSLDAIWGRRAADIREQMSLAPTTQARFALLERLLLARLRDAPPGLTPALTTIRYSVAELARTHGAVPIRILSDQMGLSQKHLITQFKRLVGGTPKELARIYRFRRTLYSIDPAQPVDWTRIAHQSHYYDESHFNKDFEAFTGHTPTNYLRLFHQVHSENPGYTLFPKYLPIG